MAAVGELIKEARKGAGLTQEKLAKKVGGGIDTADIGKAERGELQLSTAVLKRIAVVTGVTQSSLLNATKGAKKSTSVKKVRTSTPTNAGISMRVTSTEKKLIEYYRNADSQTKKAATSLLKGEQTSVLSMLGSSLASSGKSDNPVADLLGDAIGSLLGGK